MNKEEILYKISQLEEKGIFNYKHLDSNSSIEELTFCLKIMERRLENTEIKLKALEILTCLNYLKMHN